MVSQRGCDFARNVLARAGQQAAAQSVYYSPEADTLEFVVKPGLEYYAKRIDDLVTIYYSDSTEESVGVLLTGLRRLLHKYTRHLPGLEVEVANGRVKVEHLLLIYLWVGSEDRYHMVVQAFQN
jgi:hypothetical protein